MENHAPHRRSLRLQDYDYSEPGAYFVTICLQGKANLLGEIAHDAMCLNDAGRMIEHWWQELPHKYPSVELDAYVIMPSHFHGIVVKVGEASEEPHDDTTLSEIIGWFKTMTTNDYIRGVKQLRWERFDGRLWQRNYWEHVIRNESSLMSIRRYIENNPMRWALDIENPTPEWIANNL
jgi:REP element-mobilizing transposase RayT